MKVLWLVRFLFCAYALSGCARAARDIEPIYPNAPIFTGMDCGQLFASRATLQEELVFANLRQDQIHASDYTRALGVPMAFGTVFEGNDEERIGLLKGDLIALDAEILRTRCGFISR